MLLRQPTSNDLQKLLRKKMPKVGGKKYPYTAAGMKAAEKAKKKSNYNNKKK